MDFARSLFYYPLNPGTGNPTFHQREISQKMTAQTPVVRTSFRVYRTNDGRTLVEHPTRIDSLGMEPTKMLVISDSGISVGGISSLTKKRN